MFIPGLGNHKQFLKDHLEKSEVPFLILLALVTKGNYLNKIFWPYKAVSTSVLLVCIRNTAVCSLHMGKLETVVGI